VDVAGFDEPDASLGIKGGLYDNRWGHFGTTLSRDGRGGGGFKRSRMGRFPLRSREDVPIPHLGVRIALATQYSVA
jgi:hypothetical protein